MPEKKKMDHMANQIRSMISPRTGNLYKTDLLKYIGSADVLMHVCEQGLMPIHMISACSFAEKKKLRFKLRDTADVKVRMKCTRQINADLLNFSSYVMTKKDGACI